jgi:hypothetical protein
MWGAYDKSDKLTKIELATNLLNWIWGLNAICLSFGKNTTNSKVPPSPKIPMYEAFNKVKMSLWYNY